MIRNTLLEQTIQTLIRNGFSYQSFADSNSCFDLIARKQNLVLVLKVLPNIDSLRPEHARDLKKITGVFNAHSLIIGERSKVFTLNPDVLYERYDLPVLSFEGFQQLLASRLPTQRSFKGQNVVELDIERLRKEREARELTLKELSNQIGVSLESLHRYEHGSPAQLDVAEKLERVLHTRLIRGISVFKPIEKETEEKNAPLTNSVLDQLQDLGLKLSVFERAPLNAAATEHNLLISHAETKQNVRKKALSMEKTQTILNYPGLIITNETKRMSMGNIPVLHSEDISTFSSAEDMMNSLKNRRKTSKKTE